MSNKKKKSSKKSLSKTKTKNKGKDKSKVIKPKIIHFDDYPDFTPNLTPEKIFRLGSFGGTYWVQFIPL